MRKPSPRPSVQCGSDENWINFLDFFIVLLALALGIFLSAGGFGLIALGICAFTWKSGGMGLASQMGPVIQHGTPEWEDEMRGPKEPWRFYSEVLVCVGVIVLGLICLDAPGLVISFGG